MTVTGEAEFISAKTGTKKDGAEWYMLRFLDEAADSFFTAFVDATLFQKSKDLLKHTPVILTLNLSPGNKYFTLVSVEIIG